MEVPPYARHAFSSQLQELEHGLLDMGSRAEAMCGLAVDALTNLDLDLAREVLRRDDEIDVRDLEIEQKCLSLLALQQPTGTDLRTVGTVMKAITDLERIGDLSVDIAKTALKIDKEMAVPASVDLVKMANTSRAMLRLALEAFVKRDVERVMQVAALEPEVDAMYRLFRSQIHLNMRTNPDAVVADSWLLLAVHHVERIADHALNIAERVQFMVTGRLEQIAASHRSDQPDA